MRFIYNLVGAYLFGPSCMYNYVGCRSQAVVSDAREHKTIVKKQDRLQNGSVTTT